jgi:hypothetical protein
MLGSFEEVRVLGIDVSNQPAIWGQCYDADREKGISITLLNCSASYTINLGMPLFDETLGDGFRRKVRRISRVVMEAGSHRHNKDNSYSSRYPTLVEKSVTFFRRLGEYARLFAIFPVDAPRSFMTYVGRRTKAVIK